MYAQWRKLAFGLVAAFSLSVNSWGAQDVGYRSQMAAAILSDVPDEHLGNLVYVNVRTLDDASYVSLLEQMRADVLDGGMKYLIDFSAISGDEERRHARSVFQKVIGFAFDADAIVVGRYKGALIFSPVSGRHDPLLKVAMSRKHDPTRAKRTAVGRAVSLEYSLPHIAFYFDVNAKLGEGRCSFPLSWYWSDGGEREVCKDVSIALTYRINLMRSLKTGISGTQTPDAKLVRISLDADSSGAGFHLNDRLGYHEQLADYTVLDGWVKTYMTDAIAKEYRFEIKALDRVAAVLKTVPASNLNAKYEHRDTSGFDIGVTAGIDVGPDGPKAKLEGRASYNQSRTLVYNTADYRVARSSKDAQSVTFAWEREQYATAESVLLKKTGPIWDLAYPVDHTKISPISYKGFVPNFDVIYKAPPDATGVTPFQIDSSVEIWPIYTGVYKHYYVLGTHTSFQGQDGWQRTVRFGALAKFYVDWNHPVFTGGRPVNLQLGSFNSRCVGTSPNLEVKVVDCDLKSAGQSFIYDGYGRYMSVVAVGQCLDGNDLTALKPCGAQLSQRWAWGPQADLLKNEFTGQYLAHGTLDGRLSLSPEARSDYIKLRTITRFTDIF